MPFNCDDYFSFEHCVDENGVEGEIVCGECEQWQDFDLGFEECGYMWCAIQNMTSSQHHVCCDQYDIEDSFADEWDFDDAAGGGNSGEMGDCTAWWHTGEQCADGTCQNMFIFGNECDDPLGDIEETVEDLWDDLTDWYDNTLTNQNDGSGQGGSHIDDVNILAENGSNAFLLVTLGIMLIIGSN